MILIFLYRSFDSRLIYEYLIKIKKEKFTLYETVCVAFKVFLFFQNSCEIIVITSWCEFRIFRSFLINIHMCLNVCALKFTRATIYFVLPRWHKWNFWFCYSSQPFPDALIIKIAVKRFVLFPMLKYTRAVSPESSFLSLKIGRKFEPKISSKNTY